MVRRGGLVTMNCLVKWYLLETRHCEVKVHDTTSDTEAERAAKESADASDVAHARSSEDSSVAGVAVYSRRRVRATCHRP